MHMMPVFSGRRLATFLSETLRSEISLVGGSESGDEESGGKERAEDNELFRKSCEARCVSSVRMISRLTVIGTILWWPTDALVYTRAAESLRAVTIERVTMLVAPLCVLLLLRYARFVRYALYLHLWSLCLCCGVLGYGAGILGPLDEPWFHVLQAAVFVPVLMPLRASQRVVHLLMIALALWAGLLVPFPDNLYNRCLLLSVSMQIATLLLSFAFGHALFLVNRLSFMQSRVIHRDAAMLKDYSSHLEERVFERTAELRRLLHEVEVTREKERTRMSRELHDELGQELAVIGYEAGLIQKRYTQNPSGLDTMLEDLVMQLEHSRRTLRTLVTDLRPRVLDDLGLGAALEWLVLRTEERGDLRCKLEVRGESIVVPEATAVAAFRIVQESLTNVMRHSQASQVEITLEISQTQVALRVQDNGRGLDPEKPQKEKGVGLLGMRERAMHLGGEFVVRSVPGQGMEVLCKLPMVAE